MKKEITRNKDSFWWKLAVTVFAAAGVWIYQRILREKEKNARLAIEAEQEKYLESWQEQLEGKELEEKFLLETAKKKEVQYPENSCIYVDIAEEEMKSPCVALLDVEENEITAGKYADEKIYPAGLTLVMTLLVAVENIVDIDRTLEMKEEFFQDGTADFEQDDIVSIKDLLYGMMLHSNKEAALALAKSAAGSQEAFVEKMNEQCKKLNLKHTHFANVTGAFDKKHYTTAVDMAFIMKAAMQNSVCAQILSTYQYSTAPLESSPDGILFTNTMFTRMYGTEVEEVTILAGKTAYQQQAGHSLVSYAEKQGHAYIAVAAGAKDKWHVIFDHFALYRDYLPAFMRPWKVS